MTSFGTRLTTTQDYLVQVIGNWLVRLRQRGQLGMSLVVPILAAVTVITYATGGSENAAAHLFVIPIVIAAFFFNIAGGVLSGIVSGIIISPLLALELNGDTPWGLSTWAVNVALFLLIGGVIGLTTAGFYRQTRSIEELNAQTIQAFIKTIDAKSIYTARHSENVAAITVEIARAMALPQDHVERLRWAALLHDIGKLRVPTSILDKPGRLSPAEWEFVRQHPLHSVRMLEHIQHFQPYLPAIRHHHERIDGTGYPDGLEGDDIPFDARVLAVADAFEAMTSYRPYRVHRFTLQEALAELCAGAGTQFDAEIVTAFAKAIGNSQTMARLESELLSQTN